LIRALICSELSNIYYHLEEYEKALKNMQEAIDCAVEKGAYYQGLIRLLYLTEEYEKAEKVFVDFLQKKENIDFDKLLMAKINIKSGNFKHALKLIDEIKEKNHKLQTFALRALIFFLDGKMEYRDELEKIFTGTYKNSEDLFLLENLMLLFAKLEEYSFATQLVEKMIDECGEENRERLSGIYIFLYELSGKHHKSLKEDRSKWVNIMLSGVNYLFEANLIQQARRLLNILEEHEHERTDIYVLRSLIERKAGNEKKALENMREAYKLNEDNIDIAIQLMELEYSSEYFENAKNIAESLYDLEMDNRKKGFVHEILGDTLNSLALSEDDINVNEYEKAYRLYIKAQVLDHYFLFKYIETLMVKGMYGEANSLIDLHEDDNSGNDWDFLRSRIMLRTEGEEKAFDILDNIIEDSPDYYRAYVQKAIIYRDFGELEKAVNELEKATKIPELPLTVLDDIVNMMDEIDGSPK